jgi:hypothetical protein
MTPLKRPLSRFLRREHERLQTLRRYIHGCVPKRTTLLVLVSVVVVLAVMSGAALSQSGTPLTPTAETNNSTVAPGAQMVSAISVEGVVLESGLHRRTLDIKLTRATSAEERATIIATTMQTFDKRLDALETRYQQLRNARQAGTISDAKYHVEVSTIIAEARMIERTVDLLQTAAMKLPTSQFEAQSPTGITLERLGERARALASGEVITTPETPTETPLSPTATTTPTPTPPTTPTSPTQTPTATPSTATSTATEMPTPTATPIATPTPTPTPTPTATPTPEPTDTDGGDDNGDDAGESADDSDGTDEGADDGTDDGGEDEN